MDATAPSSEDLQRQIDELREVVAGLRAELDEIKAHGERHKEKKRIKRQTKDGIYSNPGWEWG